MKMPFIERISLRLVTLPMLFVLSVYLLTGLGIYFIWAPAVLSEVHGAQLVSLMSGNRNALNLWYEYRKRSLEEVTRQSAVSDMQEELSEALGNLRELDDDNAQAKRERAKIEKNIAAARKRFTDAVAVYSQFRSVILLSAKGIVLAGTVPELNGQDWAESGIFQKLPQDRGIGMVTGSNASGGVGLDLYFAAPLGVSGQEITGYLLARPDPAELAAYLRPEGGIYSTIKLSIVDAGGLVVAAQDMSEAGKVRYNVPRQGLEGAAYRDGLFYYITPLKAPGLGLIATLNSSEAARPLQPLAAVYFGFAVFLLVLILVQHYIVTPRLIDRPASRLIKAAQAVSSGDLRLVNLRKGFEGEFKLLADAFSGMVAGIGKQWSVSGRPARSAEGSRFRTSVAQFLTEEMKARLDETMQRSEALGMVPDAVQRRRDAAHVTAEIKALARMLGDINELLRFKDGLVTIVPEPLDLCRFLAGLEAEARNLIGSKEMELVIECPDSLSLRQVVADRRCLRRVLLNLIRNSVIHTEVGMITIIASLEQREEGDIVEVSFADTGSAGLPAEAARAYADRGLVRGYAELSLALEFADLIGADLAIPEGSGQGFIAVISLPVESQASETSETPEVS